MAKTAEYLDFSYIPPETEAELNRDLRRAHKFIDTSKLASQEKEAIIDKQVRSNFEGNLNAFTAAEPSLPTGLLNTLGSALSEALSSSGGMVIVIKPREFQRMYLGHLGRRDVADQLDQCHGMFRPGAPPDPDFLMGDTIVPKILQALMPLMQDRSAMAPCIHRRVVLSGVIKPRGNSDQFIEHPLMDKISSAYSAYRQQLLYNLPELVKSASRTEEMRHFFNELSGGDHSWIAKTASSMMESTLTMLPISYVNCAHLSGPVSPFVSDNCSYRGLQKAGAYAQASGLV